MTEQQHIKNINITINSIMVSHDEGVHHLWTTSPASNFQWLGPLYYDQKCEYIHL